MGLVLGRSAGLGPCPAPWGAPAPGGALMEGPFCGARLKTPQTQKRASARGPGVLPAGSGAATHPKNSPEAPGAYWYSAGHSRVRGSGRPAGRPQGRRGLDLGQQ